MEGQMTKAQLLATMRSERDWWESVLAEVGEARMDEIGAHENWSMKDVVSHCMYFEEWVNQRFEEKAAGKPYVESDLDKMYFHDRNEVVRKQHQDRPAQEVLADSRRIFEEFYHWAESLTEEELHSTDFLPDLPPDFPTWKIFPNMSYEHYRRHEKWVRTWLDNRPAG